MGDPADIDGVGGTGNTDKAPDQIIAIPLRQWGRWVAALAILVLLAGLLRLIILSHFASWTIIKKYLFNPTVLGGVRHTILLSILAQLIGVGLGVLFAVMRLSKNPVLSVTSWIYIWAFRGTPVLVQLLLWFNGVPTVFKTFAISIPFTHVVLYHEPMFKFMTPLMAALLGLGLNEGAYMAEIVRAGIISVDLGQTEAAQALGMHSGLVMRRIVLPQAMRVILPPTGNEFISMLKTSSLAYVVTYPELLRRVQDIYSNNLKIVELLLVACFWYLVLTTVATIGQFYLERRYARGSARDLPATPFQRIRRNLGVRRVRIAG
jgi:polar amino acid transport system permease protein